MTSSALAQRASEPAPTPALRTASLSDRTLLAIVLAAAALCFALALDRPECGQTDELFYMGGALEARGTGDWLVPMSGGEVRLKKPPLQYWLVGGSFELFGVGVWQGRLPSAIAALLVLALTYKLGVLLFDARRTALYGTCITATSYMLLRQAHLGVTDMVLALLEMGAVCAFLAAIRRGQRRASVAAWLLMACAVMQKGPVGILIPLGSVVCWILVDDRRNRASWRRVFSPFGIAAFLLAVLPWPLLVLDRLGWDAFLSPVEEELGFHVRFSALHFLDSCVYYVLAFVKGLFPWSLLLFSYFRRGAWSSSVKALWTWAGFLAVVFAAIVLKHRARYVVPVIPALGLLAGNALASLEREPLGARWRRVLDIALELWFVGATAVGVLMCVASVALLETSASLAVGALVATLGIVSLVLARRTRARASTATWLVSGSMCIALSQTLTVVCWDTVARPHAAYDLAREHLRDASAERAVVGVGLTHGEHGWAQVGAGRVFPNLVARGEDKRFDWERVGASPFIFAERGALAGMPPASRAASRELGAGSENLERLEPLWFLGGVDAARRSWSEGRRELVVLEGSRAKSALEGR